MRRLGTGIAYKILFPAFGLSCIHYAPYPSLIAKPVRIKIFIRYVVSCLFYAILFSKGLTASPDYRLLERKVFFK